MTGLLHLGLLDDLLLTTESEGGQVEEAEREAGEGGGGEGGGGQESQDQDDSPHLGGCFTVALEAGLVVHLHGGAPSWWWPGALVMVLPIYPPGSW